MLRKDVYSTMYDSIKQQSMQHVPQADMDGRTVEHVKSEVRRKKINSQKHLCQEIFNSLPENVTPYIKQANR